MQNETIVYIIIAGIAALLLALFQYKYKSKINGRLRYVLMTLRFISLLSMLLLLINPKFETSTYFDEKPNLLIAIDNSESIAYLKQDTFVKTILDSLRIHPLLNKRFNIETYKFGKSIESLDSLTFADKQTNVSLALKQFEDVYKNQITPIILLTDGNQTYGTDYSYMSSDLSQSIYPIILGDSTKYTDLNIKQLNVNKYTFLKNRFPVEIIASYNGEDSVSSEIRIRSGNSIVFKKKINFSANNTSQIINTSILANSVGVKTYSAEIVPLENEKNKINNFKKFGVEVMDQKTNVAIVYDQLHPDLGALKKAIESNEQRSVSILKPNEYKNQINDFQLVILYQPNNNFNSILEEIKRRNLNSFIITGASTDYEFINNTHLKVLWSISNQTEDFQPELNKNYNTFLIDNITFEDYPPLKSEFGGFNFLAPADIILYKKVDGIITSDAMLATYAFDNMKHAVLVGEGIWRWRAQTYLNTESFSDFDNFIGKLVQYLSTNKKRKRLNIDYKSFYDGTEDVILSAQYYNENYEFDATASLSILLKNSDTKNSTEVPLLLNNGNYTVDLSNMEAGNYEFTIKHNSQPFSSSGQFQIIAYNVEQQFLNSDTQKLKTIANKTGGRAFFKTQLTALINEILEDNRYKTIQKSTKNIVPLIDWKYLLGLITICLFTEWFIRKYNGLI